MGVGRNISRLRIEKGMTQKQLSLAAGISPASIHYIEREENSPTERTLKKLAAALGVSVVELLGEDGTRPTGTEGR